jgi:hypothetical protein
MDCGFSCSKSVDSGCPHAHGIGQQKPWPGMRDPRGVLTDSDAQRSLNACGCFLFHGTITFSRLRPVLSTAGGAIQIAAITKLKSFNWIRRNDLERGSKVDLTTTATSG